MEEHRESDGLEELAKLIKRAMRGAPPGVCASSHRRGHTWQAAVESNTAVDGGIPAANGWEAGRTLHCTLVAVTLQAQATADYLANEHCAHPGPGGGAMAGRAGSRGGVIAPPRSPGHPQQPPTAGGRGGRSREPTCDPLVEADPSA